MSDSKNYQTLVPNIKLPDDIILKITSASNLARSATEQVNIQFKPSQDAIDKLSSLVSPIMESVRKLSEAVKPILDYSSIPGAAISSPLVKTRGGYSLVSLGDIAGRSRIDLPSYTYPDMEVAEQQPIIININIDPNSLIGKLEG